MKISTANRNLFIGAAAACVLAGGAGVMIVRGALAPESSPTAAASEVPPAGTQQDRVAISSEQLRASGITLVTPYYEPLNSELIVQGTVASSPQGLAVLSAGADGRIVQIDKGLGDAVGRGGRVALIESREAASISADQQVASAKLRLARATYNRERKLYEAKVTARADYETAIAEYENAQAEAARASAAKVAAGASGRFIAVRSPISGNIAAAPAVLGSYITAQSELFRIATTGGLRVEAAVPVGDSYRISPGDIARLLFPGGEVTGRVRAITPSASLESRAATIVIEPRGGTSLLRAGQFVQVALRTNGGGTPSLMVPDEAVQSLGGRDVVFVRIPGAFLVRPVTIGVRTGGRVSITSGLKNGETIAAKNAFLVKAELAKSAGEEE